MLTGTVIENSFEPGYSLRNYRIKSTRESGNWILHDIELLNEQEAVELAQHLVRGPWYMHFWEAGKDTMLVLFKERRFHVQQSDRATWADAIAYGKSIGIPEDQLDFAITI